jgi:hypothetical protein
MLSFNKRKTAYYSYEKKILSRGKVKQQHTEKKTQRKSNQL